MPYTYDDFISAANSSGMLNSFNKYDLETAKKNPEFGLSVLSLKRDAAGAATPEARLLAEESINNLRKTYGNYTIGEDGSYRFASSTGTELQQLLNQSANYGPFTYSGQSEIDRLQAAVTNPDPFTYDETQDPLFGSYRKTYLREGERAAENALAKAAAANGGQVSTSALAAGQQAQNYYNAQLADIIPTLRQNAYNEHLQGLALQENALQALLNERANEQSKWRTGFDILQQNIANLQAREQQERQNYLNTETLANNAIANALTLYQTLGYATPEIAAVLGVPAGTAGFATTGTTVNEQPVTENLIPTGVNNGSRTKAEIIAMQRALKVDTDGKWGPLSQQAAYTRWGTTDADAAWEANNRELNEQYEAMHTGLDFDANNLAALAPMGMNAEQIQKALSGDAMLASQLAAWIDEKVSSGQLIEYEQNGKTKFRWKV